MYKRPVTLYELLLFVHIVGSIVWIGSGTLVHIQAHRADRARDEPGLRRIFQEIGVLSNLVFIPASLVVLVAGLLLVIDGPWSFERLWIVLGLVGYAATFATGVFMIKPRAERIGGLMAREGMSPLVLAEMRRLLILARIDFVVLYLVVANMVIKPTGDDVGVLVGMGALLVAVSALMIARARGIREASAEPAVAGS